MEIEVVKEGKSVIYRITPKVKGKRDALYQFQFDVNAPNATEAKRFAKAKLKGRSYDNKPMIIGIIYNVSTKTKLKL